MTGLQTVLTTICLGLFAVAALCDIASRTIPNIVPLVLLLAGTALRFVSGDLLAATLAGAAVFFLGEVCWVRGWLGGGDVKLLGAGTLAVPAGLVPSFLVSVGLVGGVLALLYLAGKLCLPDADTTGKRGVNLIRRIWLAECWRIRRGGPLPYAVAISSAGVFVLLQGATS